MALGVPLLLCHLFEKIPGYAKGLMDFILVHPKRDEDLYGQSNLTGYVARPYYPLNLMPERLCFVSWVLLGSGSESMIPRPNPNVAITLTPMSAISTFISRDPKNEDALTRFSLSMAPVLFPTLRGSSVL